MGVVSNSIRQSRNSPTVYLGIRTVLALFGCFETSIVSTIVHTILLEVIDQLTCARGHLGLNHFVGGLIRRPLTGYVPTWVVLFNLTQDFASDETVVLAYGQVSFAHSASVN